LTKLKPILAGTLAYTLITFTLAVVWHILLFEEKYQAFGYFQGEPSFLLGFVTILIQGGVLSFLYPFVNFTGNGSVRGLKYSLLIGVFFWSSHVLAFVAKQIIQSPIGFVAMESFYLLLQFGIYGVLIGNIYNRWPGKIT
jgi:hypothetical protein